MLKFPTLGAAFAIAALAAAPANAQVKLRLGGEAQLLHHVNSPDSTTWITDQFRPSIVGMLGFYVLPFLSIDGELAEAFQTNPPAGQSSRIGTTFRLGATIEPPFLPFYLRAAIPVYLEPGDAFVSMRGAIGTTIGPPVVHLYLELAADFPLGGAGHSFFDEQTVSVGAGLQVHL
ncbi:MAG TPA: hypothetical protein VG496_11625 [Myxococcales bacterium]|nr:hypothetical protein [Myxococcales bacterium]